MSRESDTSRESGTGNEQRFELAMAADRTLRGAVALPVDSTWPAPVLVFCHGFKGFMDWGPWPWLAETLAARGFIVVRFNFSHAGVATSTDLHDEPEKFAINTYGKELEDLAFLLEHRDRWSLPAGAAGAGLGLIGHSRGGMIALLHAAGDERVGAVATLGTPADSDRFPAEGKAGWHRRGFLEVHNARTGQVLRMDVSVLDDFEARRAEYDVAAAVARRPVPTLVVHAADDATVPVADATRLFEAVPSPRKRVEILPAGGHTFGSKHPFEGPDAELEHVVGLCESWFREHLRR